MRSFGERVLADLMDSWWIILLSLLASSGIAFLWIFSMRYVAKVMVWVSIVLVLGLLVFGCVYSYFKYDQLKDVSESEGTFFSEGEI